MTKRAYKLTKPRSETHAQNKVKSYRERLVQVVFSVRGEYYNTAKETIDTLIKEKGWKISTQKTETNEQN